MIFSPNENLRQHLDNKKPALCPTFIIDAKALYDSYHSDAINHGAADKRTNLELRVIREQVESVGGTMKWISSERQFGDGFTKISARQLLADRLRHGAVKFTFDPGYTASKKKTAAQRAQSRTEFAKPGKHHEADGNDVEDAHGPTDAKQLCEGERADLHHLSQHAVGRRPCDRERVRA